DSKETVRTRAQWTALVNYHPDDLARMKADLADFLEGRTDMRDGEYRILLPGGDYRWIRHRNKCVRDAAGRPIRVAGAGSDIDARKRAEEALRQSEERFALAVAGSNDGIMDWDIASDRMYTSERAMEILNIDSKETVRPRMELRALLKYHPDDTPRVRQGLDGMLPGRSEVADAEYRTPLASARYRCSRYRWIRYRNKCVRDAAGRPVRVAGSVSDIDAQKRIEEALRGSEQRFALAVAGSNDGIGDWDVVNDRMYLSGRALEIFGIDPKATVRTRQELLEVLKYHPDDFPRAQADVDALLQGRAELRDGEYRVQLPDGRYRWIRFRNMCVRDAAGRPLRVAGSVSDIDAQKRVEEALRASEEQYKAVFDGATDALMVRDGEA